MCTVIEGCGEVQAFINEGGSITIRQIDLFSGEDDVVVFPADRLRMFIEALQSLQEELQDD